MNALPRLSLAIPVYNEREVLPKLIERVGKVLDGIRGGPHEIVLVDDGSTDGTVEMLEAAAADDPRIVAVCLSRNFGHQVAITAVLDHVTGDIVIVMDGDLQDPPEMIPQFLAKHAEGFDVVYAHAATGRRAGTCACRIFCFIAWPRRSRTCGCRWTVAISPFCRAAWSTPCAKPASGNATCAACVPGLASGRRAF